jgi:hypothetical protein
VRTASQVDAALRRASELSANRPFGAPRVDMSPAAIDLRLRQASELREACGRLAELGSHRGPEDAPGR